MENEIEISAELTPNPDTLKFGVNRTLLEKGTRNFPTQESAQGSALPAKLFEIETVAGVMIGSDLSVLFCPPEKPSFLPPLRTPLQRTP